MARARIVTQGGSGALYGWMIECPGCEFGAHIVTADGRWTFDGNLDRPTFSPSIKATATWGEEKRTVVCHSFVKDGKIQFLTDCTHALAGQTVDLPEIE